jgi:phage-related baseplate assembly protein
VADTLRSFQTIDRRVDLSKLPPPEIIEALSFEDILAEYVRLIPEGYEIAPTDPFFKLIEIFAYREMILRQRLNDAIRETNLATATGNNLLNLVSLLGIEPDPNKKDEEIRLDAQQAFDQYSTAGSRASYQFYARRALAPGDPVIDIKPFSEKPGVVEVALLFKDDVKEETKDAIKQKVGLKLSSDEVRPLTDKVEIKEATLRPYRASVILYVLPGADRALVVKEAKASAELYLRSRERIGLDVRVTALTGALFRTEDGKYNSNIERVVVKFTDSSGDLPSDLIVSDLEAPSLTELRVVERTNED